MDKRPARCTGQSHSIQDPRVWGRPMCLERAPQQGAMCLVRRGSALVETLHEPILPSGPCPLTLGCFQLVSATIA